MHPKLTDQAVGDLPLSHGRADLLEEIMRTPVLDDTTTPSPGRAPGRTALWLAPVAAAAAVALLASSPAWWPDRSASPVTLEERVPDGPASQSPAQQPPPQQAPGHRAVLEASGWRVVYVSADHDAGGIAYERGDDQWLEVSWYPASSYGSYVEDREHITNPPAAGEPVEVLGAAGQLWAYSRRDHTVIREPERGHWIEVRAAGMDEAAYLALLEQLRLVDEAGFEAALPGEFVTDEERSAEVQRLVEEITAVSGVGPYDGAAPIRSGEADPYHLGADVAGGYACGWIMAYADAVASGDDQLADQAVEVLGTSRKWPVLLRMTRRGDFPEVIWGYADQVAAGQVPDDSGLEAAGLDC